MKSLIKKLLPKQSVVYLKTFKRRLQIDKAYDFDRARLLKYAYSVNDEYTQENLRAKITFHYHAIEKGLSNSNFRPNFGENAFKELFWTLDEYIKKEYPIKDYRFQSAICVIKAYIDLHQSMNISVDWIEQNIKKYSRYLVKENYDIGGFKTMNSNDLPEFGKLCFKELANNRYSVRDFGKAHLDDNKVFEAINIASKTPSVCNRQSWKVRYIKSPNIIKDVLFIQNGLTGNGENLNNLIIVTTDKQYMNGGHERNQTYIDGGLFTMSLVYALTSLSIATCTLNASFDLSRERKMRELIDINDSEDFIAVIAVGNYPNSFKVTKSPRDEYKMFTTIIE